MSLKDLTIDHNAVQEKLIESIISPYIRYDINKKMVFFLPDKIAQLTIQQKIALYLLALRGWEYFEDGSEIPQSSKPKDIAKSILENGSTVRGNLQVLSRQGVIESDSQGYFISAIAVDKVKQMMQMK